MTAEDIRVVEEPTLSWRALRGYMPEITGRLSIAEYLEGVRGEQ